MISVFVCVRLTERGKERGREGERETDSDCWFGENVDGEVKLNRDQLKVSWKCVREIISCLLTSYWGKKKHNMIIKQYAGSFQSSEVTVIVISL